MQALGCVFLAAASTFCLSLMVLPSCTTTSSRCSAASALTALSFQLCQPGGHTGAELPGDPPALERLWHG